MTRRLSSTHSFFQFFIEDMDVDLGRCQVGVPQSLLREPNVLGLPEQVGREGMTERVRGHSTRLPKVRVARLT